MIPVTTTTTGEIQGFRAPQTMTPDELAENLARLVWEHFSDFVSEGDTEIPITDLGVSTEEGLPAQHVAEEALIFLMWAHTRGAQLAFHGRASDSLIREGLDEMHAAIFEDMKAHGTPESQLPIFEQRVSARYAEYYAAAEESDAAVGEAVVRHLVGESGSTRSARALTDRAIAVANPLRDFLEEVDLVH